MTEVKIGLDDKSIEILDKLDKIHKQSIINFGIRLAKDTEYYKILVGEEDISIENLNVESPKKENSKQSKQKEEKKEDDILDLGDFM